MAATLQNEIRDALNRARRDRDRFRTVVLTTLLSDVRNKEIEIGGEATDEVVREVIARSIKQRKDASEQMRTGGRPELADKEDAEVRLLGEFLPPGMSEDEVRAVVREIIGSGVKEAGPLMGRLMPHIRGRFDGKEANRIAREELAR